MDYRILGRTGLEISRLVFGGGAVGGLLIDQDDATRRRAVERALAAGINWIDTAPLYGQGASERALGSLLPALDPNLHISTKVMMTPGRLGGDIGGAIERSLHESLERLGRPRVTLLQLHNPIRDARGANAIAPGQILGRGGVADALDRLRDQGLTRFIGVTALGDRNSICAVLNSGRFDTAQVYFNMINPSAGRPMPALWPGHDFSGVLACCRQNRVGVMAIRVFAGGVLASPERHGREVQITDGADPDTEEARARQVFAALADAGDGPDGDGFDGDGARAQAALRFVLSNPDVDAAVIGLAQPEHLETALAAEAAEADAPLPAAALAALDRLYDGGFV